MELVGVIGGFKKRKSWFAPPTAPPILPTLPPQQRLTAGLEEETKEKQDKEAKETEVQPKKTESPAIGPPAKKKRVEEEPKKNIQAEEDLYQVTPQVEVKAKAEETPKEEKGKEKKTFEVDEEEEEKETKEGEGEIEYEEDETEELKESSEFFGESLYDYRGRSYVVPPSHLQKDPIDHKCFLPKKTLSTVKAHEGGINRIQLFPGYGHLLLSCSMDGTVKLWDTQQKGQGPLGGLLRTFSGHLKGVKDVVFVGEDGRSFLSASYDSYVRLWDTETGQCTGRFHSGKARPYCLACPPSHRGAQTFIAGYSNHRILQWDTRRPGTRSVQRYSEHLGPVNAVAFVDNGRRFVSTADDQSIRIWDYGTPVTIKCLSEPHMHSMPSLAQHPDGGWMAIQSQDNQIILLQTHGKFRINKSKVFQGHNVAGFACQVSFSPDGKYIISGDSGGYLWIWDWKSGNPYQQIKCNSEALLTCQWHPLEPSRIITGGWDATIRYLD